MNQAIAHADDGTPGYIRSALASHGGHACRGFANDLDAADRGKQRFPAVASMLAD
jgi:hypothetical protein